MRHLAARVVLGFVALAAAVWITMPAQVSADPPAASTTSTSVSCGAFNWMDGGGTVIECGTGYRAVYLETEGTDAGYICGTAGCTSANYSTVGLMRCVGCNNGSAFTIDGNRGTVKCVSGVADASIVFKVHCAR